MLEFPEDECWSVFDEKIELQKQTIEVISRTLDKVSEHYYNLPNKFPMKEDLTDVIQVVVEEILDVQEKIKSHLYTMMRENGSTGCMFHNTNSEKEVLKICHESESLIDDLLAKSEKLANQLSIMTKET